MRETRVLMEACEKCGEYLEMTQQPSSLIAWVLANKIVKQEEYIDYLEKIICTSRDKEGKILEAQS